MEKESAMNAVNRAMDDIAGTYLTFQIDAEEYGVEILRVREIIGQLPITQVPGSAGEMLGVINLRGKVIPVVSLRRRFRLAEAEAHPHNVIIVVEAGPQGVIGLAVDAVREVAVFSAADCAPPPEYGIQGDPGLIRGLGKNQSRIRILLDIDRVLATAIVGV
jgi:purine-binding chemotaxis protein CheW